MKNKFLKIFVITIFGVNSALLLPLAQAEPAAAAAATAATAETTTTAATEAIPAAAGGESGPLSGAKNFMNSPMGVLIISGIGTIYSGILYKGAAKQEEESKENIKKIDKIIATFKDSYTAFCPKGRDDLKEPKCYCYTEDGKQNANRSNSQTCKDLWAKNNYKIDANASNYGLAKFNPDVAGCVTVDGQFDQNCKCKKLVDSNGKNACKKETTINMPNDMAINGIATTSGAKDLLQFASNSTNGNPRFDLMDSGALAKKAINARKIAGQLLSKIDTKTHGKVPTIDESNASKYASAIFGEKNILAGMNSGGGAAMSVASSRAPNPAVDDLLKKAQEKAGLEMIGSGKGLNNKNEKKKGGINLNFDEDSAVSQGSVIQDFPEKNYKYTNSDIVTDESASLFEIISNRYVQSGLKRLFDDSAE